MATPKDRPGRLDIVARARSENAPWLSALSRCRREVGHAGRAGLAGIVSLFFEACQYLERSREPGRRLARPMESAVVGPDGGGGAGRGRHLNLYQ